MTITCRPTKPQKALEWLALGAHYQAAIHPENDPEANALLRRLVRQCTGAARLVEKITGLPQPADEAARHESVLNDLKRKLKVAQDRGAISRARTIQRSINNMESSAWETRLLKEQAPIKPTKWPHDPTWLAHDIYTIKVKINRWHRLLGHSESTSE